MHDPREVRTHGWIVSLAEHVFELAHDASVQLRGCYRAPGSDSDAHEGLARHRQNILTLPNSTHSLRAQ